MKFGLSASAWVSQADSAFLERVAEAGFEGIELPVHDPADLQQFRHAHERLQATRLGVTVVGDAAPAVQLDEHLCGLIDVCTLLDARMLSGPFGSDDDPRSIEALRVAAAYAERFGVILALSAPTDPSDPAAGTVSRLVHVVDAVGAANVGLVYNTFRAHVEETSISSAILVAGERIKHVQIAENDGAAPGGGQVRWNETFAALDAIRYDGWYVVDAKFDVDANSVLGLSFLRRRRPRAATA